MTPDEKKAFKEETHTWHGCVHGYDTRIKMPCPSCGSRSLFIGSGGHITCGYLPCKSPLLSENIRDITEVSKQKDERIEELLEELQGNICGYCLKHDVADCPHNPNKREVSGELTGKPGTVFLKEQTTIERLESTNAELEKEKLNLLTCATNQAEEIQGLEKRVKEQEIELRQLKAQTGRNYD